MLVKLTEIFPSLSSQIPVYNFKQYMISSMQDIYCVSNPAYQLHLQRMFSLGSVPNQGYTGHPQFLPSCGSFLLKVLSEHKCFCLALKICILSLFVFRNSEHKMYHCSERYSKKTLNFVTDEVRF